MMPVVEFNWQHVSGDVRWKLHIFAVCTSDYNNLGMKIFSQFNKGRKNNKKASVNKIVMQYTEVVEFGFKTAKMKFAYCRMYAAARDLQRDQEFLDGLTDPS